MPGSPMISTGFADLLNPLFEDIWHDEAEQLPDMVSAIYDMAGTNGRNNMTFSQVGGFQAFSQFSGTIEYQAAAQGYDSTLTPLEWASGFIIEKKLFDDDQHEVMNDLPRSLRQAAHYTRQTHAFRLWNNAFSVDQLFGVNSEGVALCSNSHTTTEQNVSTSSGFDNLITAALSATAVTAAKIQGWGLRDASGKKMQTTWDELWYPVDLYDVAEEIIGSAGKPDDNVNNINVHQGKYQGKSSVHMTDTNNWFLVGSAMRKKCLKWSDRIPLQFAMVEDFDTLEGKWRAYMRYGAIHRDWRFVIGASVS
jgi:hypothetical protein